MEFAEIGAGREEFRADAVQAARLVRGQLLDAFRQPRIAKEFKRDAHDIVTEHDKSVEREIIAFLRERYPHAVFVGEESGTHGAGRLEWHIDPIDGTSNFARGIAYWCVSIAAVLDGQVVTGVVYDPVRDNIFSADGGGAWVDDVPITAGAYSSEIEATVVSSFPNAKDIWLFGERALESHGELIGAFQAVRNLGSAALNLAHVAAGWADATMGFLTNSWDIAAGSFILQQAGGRYFALERGEDSAPAILAPDYYAVGRGVEYHTLARVTRELSRHQRVSRETDE